jgi:hypothetical protein
MTTLSPFANAARIQLLSALRSRHPAMRQNGIIPIIIIVAIVVVLALGAMVICNQHGGVLDGYVRLSTWEVKITCHKLK